MPRQAQKPLLQSHSQSRPDTRYRQERMTESRAFVELTTYIHKSVDSGTLLFRLNEIHNLYTNRLEELGIQKQINKTRLKSCLLEHFPEAQEQYDGRNTILVFKEGMRNICYRKL